MLLLLLLLLLLLHFTLLYFDMDLATTLRTFLPYANVIASRLFITVSSVK